MSINLIHSNLNNFVIQNDSTNTTVILDNNQNNSYLSFDGTSLSSSASEPDSTYGLFTYSCDTSNDTYIYDFMDNCIVFDANSTQCDGLFDIQKDNVTIQNLTIKVINFQYISDVLGYLLIHRTEENTIKNTTITNCHVVFDITDTSINVNTNGLIGNYFKDGTITDCSFRTDDSTTILPSIGGLSGGHPAGGICGRYCGYNSNDDSNYTSNVTIIRCYTHCDSIQTESGGICGDYCGYSNGGNSNVIITYCYSSGSIGNFAGGICGQECCYSTNNGKSNVTITDCYSIGSIGTDAGGICGQYCGTSSFSGMSDITITGCYSMGNIDEGSGGICGQYCSYNSFGGISDVTITTCYSTGSIGMSAGGICGRECCFSIFFDDSNIVSKSTLTITSCYSIGSTDTRAGGICGRYCGNNIINDQITIKCCYALNGEPLDIDGHATGFLVGKNSKLECITSIDNSFSTIVNDGDTTNDTDTTLLVGRVTIIDLSNCTNCGYSEQLCLSTDTTVCAPILSAFTDTTVWQENPVDPSLDTFAPRLVALQEQPEPEPEPEPDNRLTYLLLGSLGLLLINNIIVILIALVIIFNILYCKLYDYSN
jgi:hypothetical protein